MKKPSTLAQGTTEYALILALVALVALVIMAVFGKQIAAAYQKAMGGFNTPRAAAGTSGAPAATSQATLTPIPRSIQAIAEDFMARTQSYYQANGQWPPTSGDAYFTALGLNPGDYAGPVSGVIWQPNGRYIGITPAPNSSVYVTDARNNHLQLYDGWDIWCHADNGNCYYHDMGLGQQVILSTVTVTSP